MPPKTDSERRRTNPTIPTVHLPSEGRKGKPVNWPFDRASVAELDLWVELWELPQAIVWEQAKLARVVARYCRVVLEAEEPRANPQDRSEARQLEDRLGLNPKAMASLRWEMVQDEVADKRKATKLKSVKGF